MSGRTGKVVTLTAMLGLLWARGMVQAQMPATPPAGKPAAVVNGQQISMAEVDAVLKSAGPPPVELPVARKKQMQEQALGMLVDEVLMKQFMAQYAPRVDQIEVDKKIAEMVTALKQQGKTLQDFCKEANTTEAGVRADLFLKLQWEAYSRAKVSDADAERYFHDNKDFFDGVTVRASHIVIRTPANISEAERAKVIAKLTELRQQILDKKIDFAEAAKAHSHCESAPNGGDIGFFPRKFVVEEAFARAAFSTPVGMISDVVQTEYGLHIIKVTDRKEGKPSDFTKIKEEVRSLCMEEMWQGILAGLRKTSKIEINLQ